MNAIVLKAVSEYLKLCKTDRSITVQEKWTVPRLLVYKLIPVSSLYQWGSDQ